MSIVREEAMDKKEKILEAWIMVEHLSEGDIKLNDKDFNVLL